MDNLIVSIKNGNYFVTKNKQHIIAVRDETAKVSCCAFLSDMLASGFSKEESIQFITEYSNSLNMA